MFVSSFDRHDHVAQFDPAGGELLSVDRVSPLGRSLVTQPLRGRFARLGSTTAVFYHHHGALWLRLDDVARPVTGADAASVTWHREGATATLVLRDGDDVLAGVQYAPGPPLAEDPTPFIDAEDQDFGLFVRNVLGDRERAAGIFSAEASDPMTPPPEGTLYMTEFADRFFIIPADVELPDGDLTVIGLDARPHRVDAAAIGAHEVTREQAQAQLRAQAERAITATVETLNAVLGLDLDGLDRLDHEQVPEVAAAALRALADAVEQPGGQPLGRRIDALIAQLEREFSPLFGRDPEKAREERRKGYERNARAAIADSLRAAGLEPLSQHPDAR